MRSFWLGRLLVVALAVAMLAARAPASAAQFGALYLSSLPPGADVWIDGSYIGRTPVLLDGLKTGEHSITVTKTGWKVAEENQQVNAGATTLATVQLEPLHPVKQSGVVMLHGLDPGARVSFDGGPLRAVQPKYDESVGAHRVVVKEPSARFDRTIAVYPDETTHVLYRSPADSGHSAVVAPVADYLPERAAKVAPGGRLTIRWNGHVVLGRIGDARFTVDRHDATYDAPAGMVRGKLYLPLDLILAITGGKANR